MCGLYEDKNGYASAVITGLTLCSLSYPGDPRGTAKALSLKCKFHKIAKNLFRGNVSVIIGKSPSIAPMCPVIPSGRFSSNSHKNPNPYKGLKFRLPICMMQYIFVEHTSLFVRQCV